MLGALSIHDYGKKFLERGPKMVVLKLGEEGSIGFIEGNTVKGAPYVVKKVIDTVGAGDAFAAGLLSVFLDNQNAMTKASLEKALTRANIMGALATQFKGDWEGVPALDELDAMTLGKIEIKR
jgi:2-dehydro-3-deoxygluconokinase